jgi:serine/threonine-protein kinase
VELRRFSSQPEGVVLSQDTQPGARLVRGSAIALTVSKGAARSAMPRLAGAPAATAARRLKTLQLAVLSFRVVSDAPVGTVVSTLPAPGAALGYGDQARLNVSGGISAGVSLRSPVRVPAVVGTTAPRAQARLRALGLTPDLFYVRSTLPTGLVVRQSVAPHGSARLGTLVGIGISVGPHGVAQTPVPYVVGRQATAGAALLRSTGFDVRVVRGPAPEGAGAQRVLDEQPMGGTKAPLHAVVTIVIAA